MWDPVYSKSKRDDFGKRLATLKPRGWTNTI